MSPSWLDLGQLYGVWLCSESGYHLTFRAPKDAQPLIAEFDVPNFSHVILFTSETKSKYTTRFTPRTWYQKLISVHSIRFRHHPTIISGSSVGQHQPSCNALSQTNTPQLPFHRVLTHPPTTGHTPHISSPRPPGTSNPHPRARNRIATSLLRYPTGVVLRCSARPREQPLLGTHSPSTRGKLRGRLPRRHWRRRHF